MNKFNKTKEWLIEEYLIKDRSRKEVASKCGLTIAGLKCVLTKFGIKKEKLVLTKDKLETLINKKLDHTLIEKELNIGQTTLYRYLKKYNLEIIAEHKLNTAYDATNDEIICQLYLDGYSSVDLAQEFNYTPSTILHHLQHCGVPIRTLFESQWALNNKNIPLEFNSYEKMYDLYINQKLSKKDLGIKFNCDPCVIDRVLKSFNIPIRNNSESKIGLLSGDKHPNWKGGITTLSRRLREYFSTNLTSKILKRDHYTCQLCGSKKTLQVHHKIQFKTIVDSILLEHPNLDPIKDINELYDIAINDKRFLDLNNLITYCKDCHYYKIHKYKKFVGGQ